MKKKTIEATLPKPAKKDGWWTTVQQVDGILILNIFKDRILQARHCVNPGKMEYATLDEKGWSGKKIEACYNMSVVNRYYYTNFYEKEVNEKGAISKEDEKTVFKALKEDKHRKYSNFIDLISNVEMEYARERREEAEYRRIERVHAMMRRVPKIPIETKRWLDQRELQGENFCLKNRKSERWSCSACGGEFERAAAMKAEGTGKAKDRDIVICPDCQKKIRLLTRKQNVRVKTHFCMIQPIDNENAVARHFAAEILCEAGEKKRIGIKEEIRIILFKNPKKVPCSVYYEQYAGPGWAPEEWMRAGRCFDNKKNPANRKEYAGHLYDGGIEAAFRDTAYEPWTKLFIQMAAEGIKLNYNNLMKEWGSKRRIGLVELLYRGRFHRLLAEESERGYSWHTWHDGELNQSGKSIEEVFEIKDRQKINRIREKNGGFLMLEWMRESEKTNQKISDKTLDWLEKNKIKPEEICAMNEHFSVEQAMNYLERQKREQYKKRSIKEILSQYTDYIRMCKKLHKDVNDALVYRPRELKRRHDEAVKEIQSRQDELVADEYTKKFGEAEKVLEEIREKYEYTGEKYIIRVPKKIVDIVREGNRLHHCAGATERYFDRIKQHETYICFLRKKEEPDMPYYTIEVEPGGTIRQHRGMYDEEPEIDEVKPFLREWQREIKKRMKREDRERAAISKRKREENIEELKQKNNTRVLNGLMEDFMEAM